MNDQAAAALERANEVRLGGAAYRRELGELRGRAAYERAANLLLYPPAAVQRMRIGHFLRGIRGMGERRLGRVLAASLVLHPNRQIGPDSRHRTNRSNEPPLTRGQRRRIAEELRAIAATRLD